jgi:hypothetical protein
MRLLVLGAGPAQLGLLEAARAAGVWTAVADRDPGAPGLALATRRCIVSIEDEPAVERLAGALDLDGVIAPGSDRAVAAAARVAEKVGLAHPISSATAVLVTNKLRQRERLRDAGFPQPHWQLLGDGPPGFGPPWVVRSADRPGPRRPLLVRRERDLPAAVERVRAAGRGDVVLVEEHVPGTAVTAIACSEGPRRYELAETGAATPAARELAGRAVAALGINRGLSSTEIALGPDGPCVLDVSVLVDGAGVLETAGIDADRLALLATLGDPLEPELERAGALRPAVAEKHIRFLAADAGAYF